MKNLLRCQEPINDYKRGNLLDYSYHHNDYKCIGIDLSRQTITCQQINYTGKLEEDDGAAIIFAQKHQKLF